MYKKLILVLFILYLEKFNCSLLCGNYKQACRWLPCCGNLLCVNSYCLKSNDDEFNTLSTINLTTFSKTDKEIDITTRSFDYETTWENFLNKTVTTEPNIMTEIINTEFMTITTDSEIDDNVEPEFRTSNSFKINAKNLNYLAFCIYLFCIYFKIFNN